MNSQKFPFILEAGVFVVNEELVFVDVDLLTLYFLHFVVVCIFVFEIWDSDLILWILGLC